MIKRIKVTIPLPSLRGRRVLNFIGHSLEVVLVHNTKKLASAAKTNEEQFDMTVKLRCTFAPISSAFVRVLAVCSYGPFIYPRTRPSSTRQTVHPSSTRQTVRPSVIHPSDRPSVVHPSVRSSVVHPSDRPFVVHP